MERHDASSCRTFLQPCHPVRSGPFACTCAGQQPHRVCRGLDEKRARRHRRRLHRQDPRQDRRELAASSALAKQIEQGAPADIFVSADTDWMDYATRKKSISEPTRVNLLGNSIVLIAPKDSTIDHVAIGPDFDLAKLAGNGKIATGDVKAVPVGKYAKAALEKLGAWQAAEPKFAMAESVRAALALVARGEASLGIVYATDARVEPGVKIVGSFPADSHPPIIYPVAATTTARAEAGDYLAFLRSSAAKMIFEKYGFTFLIRPTS